MPIIITSYDEILYSIIQFKFEKLLRNLKPRTVTNANCSRIQFIVIGIVKDVCKQYNTLDITWTQWKKGFISEFVILQ